MTPDKWDQATAKATALITVVLSFLYSPPSHSLAKSFFNWPRVATFIVAFIVLVSGTKLVRRGTLMVAASILVLGVIMLFTYFALVLQWTCSLEQGSVI